MSDADGEIDTFIASGCRLLGIPVRREWRDAIRLHLTISLDHARNVEGFALADEAEQAAVFTA